MFKLKVLVVDADEFYREQLMIALQEDFELFEAENTETALRYLKENKRPDVILTDLYLPPRPAYIEEGLDLLQKCKEVAPEVKIIIVTANDRKKIIAKCRELGADDYIVKPFEVDDLKKAIYRLAHRPVAPEVEPILEGIERRKHWRGRDGRQVGVERRNFWRVKCEVPISYSFHEGERTFTRESKTINISVTGVMFPVGQPITTHSILHLQLSLQSRPLVIKATGEVRWVRKVEGTERYDLGVEFIEIEDEDRERITDYIYT